MNKVTVYFSDGTEINVSKGEKLSEVIKAAGYPMDFPCGGTGKCGQCKVEAAFVEGQGKRELGEVLSCSYKIEKDLWVKLPLGLEDRGTVILTSGATSKIKLEPGIQKKYLAESDLTGRKGSYWFGLGDVIFEKGIQVNAEVKILQRFAQAIAKKKGKDITIVASEGNLIDAEEGDTTSKCYGLAVDIGTTTVVGYLIDLLTGEEVAHGAELNGQRIYGADVISRISAAQGSRENLSDLQQRVINTINKIVETVVKKAGISPDEIYSVILAGNTCMHHLVLGLNPVNLGRSPFLPVVQQAVETKASDLGLELNPMARVWVFPVIAGFVGGDTVAAILASNLHKEKGVKLLVDIGTNGELVINAHGHMAACSAAAGPALEGAQITFGMRAETGAISRVKLVPEIELEVIGGTSPKGICGSGLVDLLAELVKAKLVNTNGGFVKPEKYEGPEYLKERMVKGDTGYKFLLRKAAENGGREVSFSQEDLMQMQLAKGALRAAMELLVKKMGIKGEEVEEILLAGAFGNFLDVPNAHIIGMLPDWGLGKVRSIGNAAGEGAKLSLLSVAHRKEADEINQKVEFLELAGTADFQEAFIKGMLF